MQQYLVEIGQHSAIERSGSFPCNLAAFHNSGIDHVGSRLGDILAIELVPHDLIGIVVPIVRLLVEIALEGLC